MSIKIYWLKEPLSYEDRQPRKMFDLSTGLYRVVEQAPWIWFGLWKNPDNHEAGITWQGCTTHNVWRVEGAPDAVDKAQVKK